MSNNTISNQIENSPISYDTHGTISLSTPFEDISPEDISIYFNLDTRIGKRTCKQTCSHCFFLNEEEARNKHMPLKDAAKIVNNLEGKGYSVFPRTSDSLTNDGEFLRTFPHTNVRSYGYGEDNEATNIMDDGEIWTSGAALLEDNWEDLLVTGLENNFSTISLTFHGVLNGDLSIKPEHQYPFKNIFYGDKAKKVVSRLNEFNNNNPELKDFTVAVGVTIGRHNNSIQDLINYIVFFKRLKVKKLRFNCFYDYSKKHQQYQLSENEKAIFYKNIKWIHENLQLDFELGVSEDFGNNGVEVMGFPETVGTCQAGNQLFAIVPEESELISQDEGMEIRKIGTIAGCVDAFKPIMGKMISKTNTVTGEIDYDLEFDIEAINEVKQKRMNNHYKNGCFGPEIHTELYNKNIIPVIAA